MSMDLTQSIIPKSDQLNADEIMAPVTYTIREVKAGSVEQPFDFMLVETDRAYRPSKTMRRVIVNAWGPEAANYAGRRLTLYREPTIKFGGVEVGGIRISHMSHISGTIDLMAQTTRGRREKFTVQPLPTTAAAPLTVTQPPQDDNDLPFDPVTLPVVPVGGLRAALAALNTYQRDTLFTECGITAGMKLGDVRGLMAAKWGELDLPDYDGEPVPVSLLGAIYAKRQNDQPDDAAESFDHFARTGQDLDAGDQAVIA